MTIALELHRSRRSQRSMLLVKPLIYKSIAAGIRRFFWHTHAYATIFSLMLLTCLGMVLFSGYELARKRWWVAR